MCVFTSSSLVKNLLGALFKFTSSFVVHLLLFRHCGSAVRLHLLLLLCTSREVSAWGVSTSPSIVCLLGHSALLNHYTGVVREEVIVVVDD